jgi:hypothetical protein
MNWLRLLIGLFSTPAQLDFVARSTRRITRDSPLILPSPRIGFLDLSGSSMSSILEEDKAAFIPLFAASEESDQKPPICDVLMIYGNVSSDGRILRSHDDLREIIRKSRAPIVIVASENEVKSYIAAGKRPGQGQANLVMTLNRRGAAFTEFFTRLFQRMSAGTSMPMAWVELAPQVSGAAHENCPETIFSAEVTHIVFK